MAESANLQAALSYAQRGWPVCPLHWPTVKGCSCGTPDCQSPAKHPLTPHGLKDATTNPAVIKLWWNKWPQANIAIVTGKASGLIVLDIDSKSGGYESLKQLEKKGNLPVMTPQVNTGGGGRHIYMAYNGRQVRNRARVGGLSGIDLRGDNGYVVAPPSIHYSGEKYSWRVGEENKPSAFPDWLYQVCEQPVRTQGGTSPLSLNEWGKLWKGVGEGQRNDIAARLAGRLLGRGLPAEEALVILSLWNEHNSPPMTHLELTQTISSISRSEAQKPQSIGVMDAEYFMTADMDRPPVIIGDGLLFKETAMIITGESGAGKSLLTLELAICISKSLPWLGIEIPDPHQVLFIQAENPDFVVQSRLRRIAAGMGISHLPKMHFVNRKFKANVNDHRDRHKMKDLIEKVGAKVVILDPLSSYHQVNENDNIAMRNTLDRFTELSAETGCSWIIVHHEGKMQDVDKKWRFRGASSIRDWADTMIGYIVCPNDNKVLREVCFNKIRIGKNKASLMVERDENFCLHITEEDALVPFSMIAEAFMELGGKAKSKFQLVGVISKWLDRGASNRTIYRAIDKAENHVWYQSDKQLIAFVRP